MALSKTAKKGDPPAFITDNILRVCIGAGVKWTRDLCVEGLHIPYIKINEIERSSPTSEGRLGSSIEYYLCVDPTPSWRRIINALDWGSKQYSAASRLYKYAEPVTDSTLTPNNVSNILKKVKDRSGLCNCLRIPSNKRNDVETIATYFILYSPFPSWIQLASKLYYMKESQSSGVMSLLNAPPRDSSLTNENMLEILEVRDWRNFSLCIDFPFSDLVSDVQAWNFWLDTHPAPSWALIAEGLFQSKDHDVLKRLERQYPTVISPSRRHVAFDRAKKKGGSIDELFVQGFFSGFARSGKTSFKKRLVHQHLEKQASTGVAEKVVRVEVSQSVILGAKAKWSELDSIDEKTAFVSEKVAINVLQQEPTIVSGTNNALVRKLKIISEKVKRKYAKMPHEDKLTYYSNAKSSASVTITPHQIIESSSPSQHPPPPTNIAAGSDTVLHQSNGNTWTHYMNDVGGQPEFKELFSNLLSGPSIFYHVFRADQPLNEKYIVNYLHPNGKPMVPFESSMTTRDAILQFLASVSSMGELETSQGGIQVKPKVLFIATHIDLLKSEKDILDIYLCPEYLSLDQELQKIVKETQAYKDGMIEFASKSCMSFPINNLSDDDTGFQKIRDAVDRIITCNNDYRICTPYTWSIFSITIQHLKGQVLRYNTCLAVGKECGIDTEEEMDNCLWFLHHQHGTLRYFPEKVADCKVVIKEPQYIFDMVTSLIVDTFTFKKTGGDERLQHEFEKKGIFSIESLEKYSSKSDPLKSTQVIKILEHLHIVAPLRDHDGMISKYFLPCSLVHADTQKSPEVSPSWLPPLLFAFNSGYCPGGVFGAMVSDLLQHRSGLAYDWKFKEHQIFRNQICFVVGPLFDKFRFTLSPTHVTIEVLPYKTSDRSHSLASVCCHVQDSISKSLFSVAKKLNYAVEKMAHQPAFLCPNTTCYAPAHPATINLCNSMPSLMECSMSHKPVDLPVGYELWFDKCYEPKESLSPSTASSQCIDRAAVKSDAGHGKEETDSSRGDSSLSDVSRPNLTNLTLIKWTDSEGKTHKIRVIEEISNSWEEMGSILDITSAKLTAYRTERSNNNEACCREVLSYWLKCNGSPQYPVTWDGLIELLVDIQHGRVVDKLSTMLKHLTSCRLN